MTRHYSLLSKPKFSWLATVPLGLSLVACKSQSAALAPATAPSVEAANARKLEINQAAETDQNNDSSALAAQAAAYANQVQAALNHRQTARGPASKPSVVKFVEPAEVPGDADVQPGTPAQSPVGQNTSNVDNKLSNAPGSGGRGAITPRAALNDVNQQTAAAGPGNNATLAAARLKADSDVPMIIPESADNIPMQQQPAGVSSDELEKKLAQLVADYPRDLANQLQYQMLRFVRDEPTPDLQSINQLLPEDREVLATLLDGLNNFRNTTRADGNQMLSRKIQPLVDMVDRLKSQAELTIPTIALCKSVESYGVYTPLPSTRLPVGRANEVVLYCEVANFTSIQGDDKIWKTSLKEEVTLYTDSGLVVWPDKSNALSVIDKARIRRHDFFIARKITLPSNLQTGRYWLKVSLTDGQPNRGIEATTPLEIIAP